MYQVVVVCISPHGHQQQQEQDKQEQEQQERKKKKQRPAAAAAAASPDCTAGQRFKWLKLKCILRKFNVFQVTEYVVPYFRHTQVITL